MKALPLWTGCPLWALLVSVALGFATLSATSVRAAPVAHALGHVTPVISHIPSPKPAPGAQASAPGPGVTQSASGLTSVEVLPLIVRTHDAVSLRVHSLPWAGVSATISYPDGQSLTRHGRTSARGWYLLKLPVVYEPVDSSAVAGVTIVVTRGAIFSDTVQTTFTVLHLPVLTTAYLLVRPNTVHTGQTLEIRVHTSLPYVQVHITVLDPSQQSVSADGSTDAGGNFLTTVPVSYSPHGLLNAHLLVTALLSYEGQTRLLQRRIPIALH